MSLAYQVFRLMLVVALLALLPSTQCISIAPSSSVPDTASPVLDQSYLSFAVEGRDFAYFSGNDTSPNMFSINMLSTFSKKTGAPTYLRLGGTSEDHLHYDPTQAEAMRFDQPDLQTWNNLDANITVGPDWVQGFRQFSNLSWDLQIPLARKNLSNALIFARACLDVIGADNFHAFEIGNEPDIYNSSGFTSVTTDRPSGYDPEAYVKEWTDFAKALLESNADKLGDGARFQAFGYSNYPSSLWTEKNAFEAGLSSSLVRTVSEHYYQGIDGQSLQDVLMNHTRTVTQVNGRFKKRLAYMKNAYPDIPFVVGEVGSALKNSSGIRDFDLDASLGTALWTVDWLLYVSTLGITRVNMQIGTRWSFSPWLPVEAPINNKTYPAQTLGSFYGNVFVADLIGTDGKLQIAELSVSPSDAINIVAYGVYNSGTLTKVALIDLELWRESSGTARSNRTVTVNVSEAGVQKVKVERLTGPDGGAQADQITWAGLQWTKASDGLPVKVRDDTEEFCVLCGQVDVVIQASEALLITIL